MLKRFLFNIGITIASTSIVMQPVDAAPLPLPTVPSASAVSVEANAPLCYIQFQGSSAINVSNVCGKIPETTPRGAAVSVSNIVTPPIFNPRVMNATTGACYFIDANGKPCPQK